MQHFQFHIGDYAQATAHLSPLEDLAYRRLLDLYYSTEAPIQNDTRAVSRKIRLDQDQVEQILKEFFILTPEGFRHHRCDEELEAIYSKSDSARKSAEKRWDRYRNANAMRTHSEPDAFGMLPVTRDPLPVTQEPESKALSGKPDIPHVNGKKKLSEACAEVLEFLNEKTGRNYKPVPANINLIAARIKQGATVVECRQVIAKKCREWRDDPTQEIYLRPKTLFNATNFANYQGELGQ